MIREPRVLKSFLSKYPWARQWRGFIVNESRGIFSQAFVWMCISLQWEVKLFYKNMLEASVGAKNKEMLIHFRSASRSFSVFYLLNYFSINYYIIGSDSSWWPSGSWYSFPDPAVQIRDTYCLSHCQRWSLSRTSPVTGWHMHQHKCSRTSKPIHCV